jgi:hypothetical protein
MFSDHRAVHTDHTSAYIDHRAVFSDLKSVLNDHRGVSSYHLMVIDINIDHNSGCTPVFRICLEVV